MRRSFTEILRKESPISLAREALWRTRKGWYRRRLLAQLEQAQCPVKFRNVSYYAPGATTLCDTSKAFITGYADEIGHGRFPFLGYGTQHLGYEPEWNVDFVSGLKWEPARMNGYVGLDIRGADIKVPWELSRLQFLPILGKAYVITGDEHYRDDAKRLMSDWIMKNPVGVGVNWSIAMEAALRAMSICFFLNLLSPFRREEQNWLRMVTRSLWHHMLFIEAHTEFSHLIRSNHYLSNVIGLYCLSEFLDGVGMPERRRAYRQKVESEILRQVYEDGGDYEASTGYHVLVTQMFTSGLLLMQTTATGPEPRFVERLRRMYLMMERLASPSGKLPHVGDCDDGRVELLLDDLRQMLTVPVPERDSLQVSNLLGIGSYLFGGSRGSLEDARWYALDKSNSTLLSGTSGKEEPRPETAVFAQSGMSVARSERAEVLFFAIPNGISGKGSHNHNDKLSFVLRLDGEEVFCDSGTCTYTRDPKTRNRFRATSAHNTVSVDDHEQNTIEGGRAGLFSMGCDAGVSPIAQSTEDEDVVLRAYHTGYQRFGVKHTRSIRLRATKNMAIVDDELRGGGIHRFEINFQVAPGWKISLVESAGRHIRARISGASDLQIVFQSPSPTNAQKEESWVSLTYGASTPADRLRIWGELNLPAMLTTTITWDLDRPARERITQS